VISLDSRLLAILIAFIGLLMIILAVIWYTGEVWLLALFGFAFIVGGLGYAGGLSPSSSRRNRILLGVVALIAAFLSFSALYQGYEMYLHRDFTSKYYWAVGVCGSLSFVLLLLKLRPRKPEDMPKA